MSLLASTWTRGHLCHPCTMTVLFSFINLSSLKKLQEKEKGHVVIHRLECLYNARETTMINSVLHPINNKAFNDKGNVCKFFPPTTFSFLLEE